MGAVKISVKALAPEKAVFSNAAKNARDVIETVKNAQRSIGSDRMFDEARRSLARLAELIEKRARTLEALTDALEAASVSYGNAQSQGVKAVTELKAHNTDFYGNPVHVSAASGAAAAAAGTAAYSTETGAVSAQGAAAAPAGDTVINNYEENIYITNNYNGTDSYAHTPSEETVSSAAAAAASAVPSAASAAPSVSDVPSAALPHAAEISTAVPEDISSGAAAYDAAQLAAAAPADSTGGRTAAVVAGGALGAAALVGAAAGLTEIHREKTEKKIIEKQLEEAREKLRRIENEEDRIRAASSADDVSG